MAHDSDERAQTAAQCPRCGGSMRSIALGETTIDRCTNCAGLWMNATEKDRLLSGKSEIKYADIVPSGAAHPGNPAETDHDAESGTADGSPTKKPELMTCPRDRSKMIRMVDHHQPHVHYEGCTICGGVFLDSGELRDLKQHSFGERLRSFFRKR